MSVKFIAAFLALASFISHAGTKEAMTPEGLEYCTVCHGSQLKGNVNIGAPRLTGLSQWYVERQLNNFKNGIRGSHPEDATGEEMMRMVGNLSKQQLSDIAQWVTTTASEKPSASLVADVSEGEKLYQSCAACHGSNAEGNKAMGAPKLSGLNDWYILTQLNHFRLGIRGTKEKDIYGQQMKAASSVVTSEQDAANLAAYVHQLK
ncbi:c-type cytochrome [Paraglaciecola aquimarina]|uniref:C-type cytochrome n=1 Tax=Paraglaciecola aquimarina TaxID=1235557 RepID=A0ABU3SRP7_9ALTE|nr:c-type cytochrome [Paraglaciecola aquimarina]MDU0352685.1 c-type cytochrome [Paraglaciecola aquimarina]